MRSYASGPSTRPLSGQTVGESLAATAALLPEGLALVSRHQGVRFTWRELSERVARLLEQFATLDTNYKDINALLAKLNTELKARAPSSVLHAVPKAPS